MAAKKAGGDKTPAKVAPAKAPEPKKAAAPVAPVAKAAPAKVPAAPKSVPAAPASKANVAGSSKKGHGFRRRMQGRVIRDKMTKTVTVEVVSARRDPLYGKYVRVRARYKAHDESNVLKIGDEVEIQESAPLSREKRFVVTRLVKKFVEE